MNKKIFITDADPKSFERFTTIYRYSKKNQKSFRLTQSFLKNIWNRGKKISKIPKIILTIPANTQENYIIECIIKKERKI